MVNFLAANHFNQYDLGGWDTGLTNQVIDIRKYPSIAVEKEDGNFITDSDKYKYFVNTKGWDFQIRWKDQSTSWLSTANSKASNPI